MDSEYDRKFEEMKKYIPFLESMIQRLESTTSTSNPRQAQLDKIRSLRDLLMDKKKRMKMENLLKCEQVLVNLYAKVEQRDSLVVPQKETSSEKGSINLNVARNKLKSVVSKLHDESDDTLPEIARASETEEICVPGSKEPALFQRRPNISSSTPMCQSPSLKKDCSSQNVKRNYTRLLLSPERNSKSWIKDEPSDAKPFIIRSPKTSPRRPQPSYHRKERKKDETNVSQSKDLNITLNVPEESLHSLNTKDIVSRIINCNDNDVDIDTLRELRTQILGELKETGAKDDISDIILKSYKKKDTKDKNNEEVEEGELSDSESEAIESIYGSLVIMDKDNSTKNVKTETTDNTQCKIQICLVINSDKQNLNSPKDKDNKDNNVANDNSDFETFHTVKEKTQNTLLDQNEIPKSTNIDVAKQSPIRQSTMTETFEEETKKTASENSSDTESNPKQNQDGNDGVECRNNIETSNLIETIKPNFYKPLFNMNIEDGKNDELKKLADKSISEPEIEKDLLNTKGDISENVETLNKKCDVEIPLLDSHTIPQQNIVKNEVSEIDILQALKNEILSETSNVLNTDVVTPLFQPKLSKVTNAQEIGCKKRISIEKYKAKTITSCKTTPNYATEADVSKKQSLKLTEKECERFNFLSKLSLDASSDEDKSNVSMDDIYGNLAPKSPDHDDFADKGLKPPIIIPSDPVETPVVSSEADVDMRNLLPHLLTQEVTTKILSISPSFVEIASKPCNNENNLCKNIDTQIPQLVDPRMKRDSNPVNIQVNAVSNLSSNILSNSTIGINENVSLNFTQALPVNVSGVPSNLLPNMTPNRKPVNMSPNLAPNRTNIGNMTPSRQAFDNDDGFNSKHVYAPTYQTFETQGYKEKSRKSRWGCDNNIPFWEDVGVSRNRSHKIPIWENDAYSRNTSNNFPVWEEGNSRSSSMQRDGDYISTYDHCKSGQRHDTFNDGRDPYNRQECIPPNNHFSRMDCPATPTPSFGRIDPTMTPVHSFGRADCPPTPSHPFGRQEPLNALSNFYGGSDYSHHNSNQNFCNTQVPRLNRNSDYDNTHSRDRERLIFYDSDQNSRYSHSDSYRRFQREQSVGRNERGPIYDQSGRDYRESQARRDNIVGRQYNKDAEGERSFTRNRGNSRSYDYRQQSESKSYDEGNRRGFQHEKSASKNTRNQSPSRSQISPSAGRSIFIENKLDVSSHSGHFTIDTKSTFQERNKNNNSTFDARRQRASSVGRSLACESTSSRGCHESKQLSTMSESENKNKHFRRASSVGREIRESKSDFTDIKASLKSFKLKSDSRVATYFENKKDPQKQPQIQRNLSRKEIYDNKSFITKGKYSPKKNNRDPRMRRESYDVKNKYRDHKRSNSRDSKNCGIVYSNDNITKGTILGSGYGVKNYKIPKIKRNIQVTESNSNNTNSSIEVDLKDNIKNENKFEEENKEVKTKHLSVKLTDMGLVKDMKLTADKQKQDKDNNENKTRKENIVSDPSIDSNNENEEIRTIKQKENISEVISESSFENNDRRITRSARKNLCENKNVEISPVKRTRKPKKVFFIESDSDDNDTKKNVTKTDSSELSKSNEIESINEKHAEESLNVSISDMQPLKTLKTEIVCNDNSKLDMEYENNLTTKLTLSAIDKHNQLQGVLGSEEKSLNSVNNKDLGDISKNVNKNESKEMDSNFGMDDLGIFSDNIASDPVIDNINALIADLDDDLESNKNLESSKSQFTQELNLETMLENISNPDIGNNKNDLNLSQNTESVEETALNTIDVTTDIKTLCNKNPLGICLVSTTNEKDYISNNVVCEKNVVKAEKSIILPTQACANDTTSKLQDETTKTLPEHTTNGDDDHNEGVVSTTDNKLQTMTLTIKEFENGEDIRNIMDNGSNLTAPDSTIQNSDIVDTELQKNLPDSTEKLPNDMMNSDVTSTHNVNVSSNKNFAEPVLCNTDTSEIENIGKLLSILQDKSKIKELLGLLGDQSNENDKIKKKLEKLSEIVSDDEDCTKINADKKELSGILSNVATEESEPMSQQSSKISDAETISNDNVIKGHLNNLIQNEEEGTETDSVVPLKTKDVPIDTKEDQNSTVDALKTKNKKTVKNATSKKGKKKTLPKNVNTVNRRLTRSDAAVLRTETPTLKKPSRELENLKRDLKESLRGDLLNATGIRMCRIAKLVDEKRNTKPTNTDSTQNDNEPIVVLKKCKNLNVSEESTSLEKGKKAKGVTSIDSDITCKSSQIPETKMKDNNKIDPYDFETDSLNEVNKISDKNDDGSESDFESMCSSKSFGSTDHLTEVKKKTKRKRGKGWKAGIIKSKKKKSSNNRDDTLNDDKSELTKPGVEIPDLNCFIDKTYYFDKQNTSYDCRLCVYSGVDIVNHYKKQHPHTEIPCARMSPSMAQEAIKESEEVNFQAISGISSKKYVCRFCFQEFSKKKPLIETFFWHVVSMHTGEYKQLCLECVNVNRCPFNLDIPPPPKEAKGQLLGYICEKCNYTQISLENLKTHVILRHNDEQTAVYTINLAVMTKKSINTLLKQWETDNVNNEMEIPRVLRSSRSNLNILDSFDHKNNSTQESTSNVNTSLLMNKPIEDSSEQREQILQTTKIQSKIAFENDNMDVLSNYENHGHDIKVEVETNDVENECEQDTSLNLQSEPEPDLDNLINSENSLNSKTSDGSKVSDDIFDHPHFKIKYSSTGSKDYICCINGDEHYRSTLLISFKKHVQLKHSEKWDGYCFVCKVIVTPQGKHLFKDCLQHFLDKHIDNFPILEESSDVALNVESKATECDYDKVKSGSKSYINVRPISELISNVSSTEKSETTVLPVIESVISLGITVEQPHPSPSYPTSDNVSVSVKRYKYEEAQAEMMTKKHRVVLDAMMSEIKLGHVFKCAGRFCSFTTDSAEDALLHASTHARLGGEDSLNCVYCDFDSYQNAIDLITHVFKNHGSCQYVCGQCFYRAAASQLVNAHIKRVHEAASSVAILRTTFKTATSTEDKILSREEAVPHYVCGGDNALCKFRTYTPGKFCEHLQLRHGSTTELKCFMCTSNFKTPADLIRHLKTHGLKLYQCSWCVYGADNEAELLAHSSAFHPTQQPKAFLRIITNKEGSSELRVLPLAHLNKSDVPAVDIAPSKFKENPVREAERSIELEKLIGQTTLMIESMASSVDTSTSEKELDTTSNNESELRLENANNLKTPEPQQIIPRTSTPIPKVKDGTQKENVIKTEVLTPEKSTEATEVVYCLDSDDDASSKNNKASNTSSDKETKVPFANLFLCAKCKMVLNTGIGLKRHMFWCYATVSDPISCAHCSIKINKADLLNHYLDVHSLEGKTQKISCSKCPREFYNLSQLKAHRKAEHSNAAGNKSVDVSVLGNLKQYPAVSGKVKRSLGTKDKTGEPPEKTRRFGPQDVDQLPINPILDDLVFCTLCEFNTKVRLNMVRHLQLHAQQQPVPQTAPVNPVPHLETNEKHFDKMVNLASSSIITRTPDKNKADNSAPVTLLTPEAASRFPKYVPEKHRLTCGARGCSYTSVDESMLKYHWETLHHGATDFLCVHCPPRQNLDMSQPLTLTRIMAHLKMHDSRLYACSLCTYYHHKREIVQKHLNDTHKGGQVMVVREGATGTSTTTQVQTQAPTMDLKPWHCGLCSFKSLLRPEVVDHCAKEHNSKMQYKCAFCAFRTSNAENISKHQSKSHASKTEEIFYYYYREGSVPDEPDGTERWQKQSQKNSDNEPQIKSEASSITPPPLQPLSKPGTEEVDLNLVKKEIIEPIDENIDDLCRDFGEFCEPNGLKYKCSLCKNVIEDNIEAIQSHLYEELKYRKWGCSICSYKAFHKAGLSEHMIMEHHQNRDPIALQVDHRVEMWVNKLLEHQTSLIEKYKENLVKQKVEILRSNPGPSSSKPSPQQTTENTTNENLSKTSNTSNKSIEELEKLFGSFGTPLAGSFCCPKCNATFKDEDLMQNHLEGELNKIRWYCSECFLTFQTYHEAQFHCRSAHASLRPAARPVEAPRDAAARSAWLHTVLAVQRRGMEHAPAHDHRDQPAPDDSLLVVRYEERLPIPEVPVRNSDHDSDDEKLVIDEPSERRTPSSRICNICGHVSYHSQQFRNHALKHYNLRPYDCGYCDFNGARRSVVNHQKKFHAPKPLLVFATAVPKETPLEYIERRQALDDADESICLVCQHTVPAYEIEGHVHGKEALAKRGDIVIKCNVCLSINKDVSSFMVHHKTCHPTVEVNYASTKLNTTTFKGTNYKCNMCLTRFTCMKDLRTHFKSKCSGPTKKPTTITTSDEVIELDDEEPNGRKRKIMDTPHVSNKKVAKKSTTKLPHSRFARKSTTKLPFNTPKEGEGEPYSFYGTVPTTDNLNAITTMMPFCNTMVPFTLKKLNEIININPVVMVDKIDYSVYNQ